MTKLILERMETSEQGTFGKISVGGVSFFTGELPWRENKNDLSCIPEGAYLCKWTLSPRFKRFTYELVKVPKRIAIRAHSANFCGAKDKGYKFQLNGCIALGEKLGFMDGQKALLLSAPAVRRFEKIMNKEPFMLEIRNAV